MSKKAKWILISVVLLLVVLVILSKTGVFGKEEDGKPHAGVLHHVPGNNLGFALDNVEGMAVGFSHARDQVDQENRQQGQPVPGQETQALVGRHASQLPQPPLKKGG